MNFYKKLLTIFFLTIASPCYALSEGAIVKNISFDNKQNIEVIINKKSDFKAYNLHDPERLVVDIANASFDNRFDENSNFPSFVTGFRKSKSGNILRIVFDLNCKVSIKSSVFQKLKKEKFGKILIKVIPEFVNKPPITEESNISSDPVILAVLNPNIPQLENPTQHPSATSLNSPEEIKYVVKKEGSVIANSVVAKPIAPKKIPIIAVDAGHGGKDPGTIGDYARTKEKIITLAYARELGKHLMMTKNYKVYLIRDSDEFVPLKRRVEKARRLNADLFISLHANSAADRNVAGFSIYTLSEKSSDKQAELLAQKENRADIIAGVNFGDASGDILKTLIDLSQRSSMNSSSQFANIAIQSVQKSGVEILHNTHRFAGFAVLTAPDMTSILIELGYLSNRQEEVDLNSFTHKRNIVKGLVDAIDEYFRMNGKK
ncbi:MAG: N-acetylmuramoyl-L-alanine amidase [Rickettsiales bacterium]|nr:N-acetylmuramoyl-L-alanine amidase [Rickettsiales bacterium]